MRRFALRQTLHKVFHRGSSAIYETMHILGHPAVAAHSQVTQREFIFRAVDIRFAVGGRNEKCCPLGYRPR